MTLGNRMSQCIVYDTQMTVKACEPLVGNVLYYMYEHACCCSVDLTRCKK